MAYVGAAASAQHGEARAVAAQVCVLRAQLGRVTRVQRSRLVELGVALARGVGPQAAQPSRPGRSRVEDRREVRRVGAVDAEVGGGTTGGVIDEVDGVAERGPVGQCAVCLDRERYGDGDPGLVSRVHDADGLVRVGDRHRMHHVGLRCREGLHLLGVIVAGLLPRHPSGAVVAVSARPDAAAHHDGGADVELGPQLNEGVDSETVRFGQSGAAVTEQVSPVRAGAPGGGFEDESGPRLCGDGCVLEKVAIKTRSPGVVAQQRHGREVRQLIAVVKDQRRLEAGVGQERLPVYLRECVSISGHGPPPRSRRGFREVCRVSRDPGRARRRGTRATRSGVPR